MRFKNRYLLFELLWDQTNSIDETLSPADINRAIKEVLLTSFGDFGMGVTATSLNVKYFNNKTNICIIRCCREYYKIILASVTLIRIINKKEVVFKSIHIAGTIRSCQLAAIDYNKKALLEIAYSTQSSISDKTDAIELLNSASTSNDAIETEIMSSVTQ